MPAEVIDLLESLIQEDVGRNISALFEANSGGLARAAKAIATHPHVSVGIITGFFVPGGTPPAAETDGPIGAAVLATGLALNNVPVRVLTDRPCAAVCASALKTAQAHFGLKTPVALELVDQDQSLDELITAWRRDEVTHVCAIERLGLSRDGIPRNMRGEDCSAFTAPLDHLFAAGPWEKLAIGDGGNEIGMGALPAALIGANIAHGDRIGCATAADELIVAGVSNWGAYGLVAALAVERADWREALIASLAPELANNVLGAIVTDASAVDGVTQRSELSVDGIFAERHYRKLDAIRSVVVEHLKIRV